MQAPDSPGMNLKERLAQIVRSVNDLSKLQIAVMGALLLLIMFGSAVAYMRARPREVTVKETRGDSLGEKERKLTVHVAGAVAKPGLYRLAEGARVADALTMAGGATADGILDDVNLASRLKDGQKILVPSSVGGQVEPGTARQENGPALLNINTADESELDELPGIGPSLAKRIVEYRRKNGPFSAVEELDDIEGIGPRKLEDLKGQVTI